MLDRLNGWQRIGVLLTGAWLIFILALAFVELADRARSDAYFVETIPGVEPQCTQPAAPSTTKTFTFEEAHGCARGALAQGRPDRSQINWVGVIMAASIPPIFGWGAVYALIALISWVAKGFRRPAS
ncbi:hypothetical protein [Noviluteimonas dokdonensis]|uniref:hypothetical protein n=1 Tax=Noviluteimonas dokdonensis TaxID=414050 RepID=UPI00055CCB66|nr:hypothetical protein [Lysobacter dokdonensis]